MEDFLPRNYVGESVVVDEEEDIAGMILGPNVTMVETWEGDWLEVMTHLEGKVI